MYKYNLYSSWDDNNDFWNDNIKDCSKNKKLINNINIKKQINNGKYNNIKYTNNTNNLSKNRNREYKQFISNYTNNNEFVEDTDTISRIIYTTFNILKIKKVYANGNTNILYDHFNQSRLLPTPRRSRIQ
jgi:hypothetical protein